MFSTSITRIVIHLQSYMEDHLKKKDRLDQEWASLCTYEADPGRTTIAEKVQYMNHAMYLSPNELRV